jgi:Mn2+/Fe2+ NRAMP family transporter
MKLWKKILIFLSVMGPGIITANIDNDASGITTYSVAGARFGYSLLWTLIPTTIALVVIQEMDSPTSSARTTASRLHSS